VSGKFKSFRACQSIDLQQKTKEERKMNITNIKLNGKYQPQLDMANRLGYEYEPNLPRAMSRHLESFSLSEIDALVKCGNSLSFVQAYAGMGWVLAATNNKFRQKYYPRSSYEEAISKGSAFLQLMAVKESLVGITAEEVAGVVACGLTDLLVAPRLEYAVETCGMGGDRGWGTKAVKTINASTLSAVVMASLGITALKHGSYGNTTRIGSTDVPVCFGANICSNSRQQIADLIAKVGFWYSDAHAVKTLHYLSHLLMIETINHIVGPMTTPISADTQLYKVMGVNHFVHPQVIAQAYALLHREGLLNVGRATIVCGLSASRQISRAQINNPRVVKDLAFLDEVSPHSTLLSVAEGGRFLGNFVVDTADFGVTVRESKIQVPNSTEALMEANRQAITGENKDLADYLAANAGLALWTYYRGDLEFSHLPEYVRQCQEAIYSGRAYAKLMEYVEATRREKINMFV